MANNALLQEERSTPEKLPPLMVALADLSGKGLDAANSGSPSTIPTPIFKGIGAEHSEKIVSAKMAHFGRELSNLDKPKEFHSIEIIDTPSGTHALEAEPKLLPKNYLLRLEFQALLDSSMNALKDDPSGQNTQKVLLNVLSQALQLASIRAEATDAETQAAMLDVMERSAHFVEANVAVPQFNTKETTGVRTLVFNVYNRLAKVLGRNTPEAVRADTKVMISMMAERIDHTPGFGRASKVSPQEHITNVVMPFLDNDGKEFAHDMSVYHSPEKPSLMKFYRLLATRHSRSKHSAVR